MKNYIYKIGIIATLFFICGCSVDEFVPENSLTVELIVGSEDDITNLNIGTYAVAGNGASYGGQVYIMSELLGNTNDVAWDGTFTDPDELIRKAIITSNGFVTGFFNTNYRVINQANVVLENLEFIESSDDKRNRIEGEAKFLRAMAYFDLVRFFAKQGDGSQIGVSMRLRSTLQDIDPEPRSTAGEVYAQVIADLTDAIALLPTSNGFFADKATAQGLLARVYLQQANYPAARDLANTVISTSGHSLTGSFEDAFNNTSNSSEDIFSFQVTQTEGTNLMNVFWATSEFGGRSGNPDIEITDDFVSSYPANDARGAFFYTSGNSGVASTKWQADVANVGFMRLAEMHLIRAEGNLRSNTSLGATPIEDLNALRNRAMAAPYSGSVSLNDIIQERRLELAFEGHLIHDVKRLGLTAGNIQADDNKLVLPIPQDEINTNPLTTQNAGY